MSPDCEIREIDAREFEGHIPALTTLLIDAVDDGASVGFLPPLSRATAIAYWKNVNLALQANEHLIVAAFDQSGLVGSVQLRFASLPNSTHRAEVMKLFVLRRARRRGLARALMICIHNAALRNGRTLLIADTRVGGAAERLAEQLGYVKVGIIPKYARSADGKLDGTVIMYRWLEETDLVVAINPQRNTLLPSQSSAGS